ncbi:MAG: PorT family protein [Bacteroidales bacterium]|nr:PorT family protein [Bacteroidales bacterium]
MQNNKIQYLSLLLILLLLIPDRSFSQDVEQSYPKQIGIGLKSGITSSLIDVGIPVQQMSSTFVPTVGFIFTYIHAKTVGIQLEANYISKSWEENPISDYTFNTKLNYIEIPMLTTLHFGNRFKFLINFGPYISILLHEESSHNIAQESDYYPFYENRTARKGDFGMTGGAGFRLQTKIGLFQIEGRYTYGFQNVYDVDASNLDYSNLKTMAFYLSYQFSFSDDY